MTIGQFILMVWSLGFVLLFAATLFWINHMTMRGRAGLSGGMYLGGFAACLLWPLTLVGFVCIAIKERGK